MVRRPADLEPFFHARAATQAEAPGVLHRGSPTGDTMPNPWEVTEEEMAAEVERLEGRRRVADRADAGLYSEMYALLDASEEELRAQLGKLPANEGQHIGEYRRRRVHDRPSLPAPPRPSLGLEKD